MASFFPNKTDTEVYEQINFYATLLFKGITLSEIERSENVSGETIYKYLSCLNKEDFEYKNESYYQEIMEQIPKNAAEAMRKARQKSKQKLNSREVKLEQIADEIINKKISVETAVIKYQRSFSTILDYLRRISNKEKKAKLMPILAQYPNFYSATNAENNGFLVKQSSITKKEIILMALTYRVSYKSLATMFQTTIEDIINMFKEYTEFQTFLENLDAETRNEEKWLESYAYEQACSYWEERTKLNLDLKELTKRKDGFAIKLVKAKQRKLHTKIDDTMAYNIKEKKFATLTEEERNKIAWYRIKYSLTKELCCTIFKINKESMVKCEKELAQKDKIYATKLDYLNSILYNNAQKKSSSNLSPTNFSNLVSLKEPINPDFFNVKLSSEIVPEEEELTQGRGTSK